MELEGKVAIVTGGAQGIGRAIAEGLAEEGASIVIADLGRAEESAREMKDKGFQAIGVVTDVSSEADTVRMAAAAVSAFGRIDILVNNAGIYSSLNPGPFEQITVDAWRKIMDVNVMGMFLASKAIVPTMRAQKDGRIINIASGTPYKGVPYLLHYVTSKGAVIAFTRALCKEVGGDNILVNTIAPGFTLSQGVLNNPVQIEKLRDVSLKARIIMRDQHPADVVGAVKFFAGPNASFITGQSLVVDGGAYFN